MANGALPEPANQTAWYEDGKKDVVLVRADGAQASIAEYRWYEVWVGAQPWMRRLMNDAHPSRWIDPHRGPFVVGGIQPAPDEFADWVLSHLGRKS